MDIAKGVPIGELSIQQGDFFAGELLFFNVGYGFFTPSTLRSCVSSSSLLILSSSKACQSGRRLHHGLVIWFCLFEHLDLFLSLLNG